jgi:hypothetical protein
MILVRKSRIIRWAGHVALLGDRTGACCVLVYKPETDHLDDPGMDERTTLRWFCRN